LLLLQTECLDPEWKQHDEETRQLDEARDGDDDGDEDGEDAKDGADNKCKWADCNEIRETAEELYVS
jgi:hypothetical protein